MKGGREGKREESRRRGGEGDQLRKMREGVRRGRNLWQRFFRRRRGGKDKEKVERRERDRSL